MIGRKILFLFFIAMTIVFTSCENDMKTVDKLTAQKDANIETGTDIEILYSDLGIVKARLLAPTVKHYKSVREPFTEMPDGIKLFFYNDSLKENSRLTADYGMIREKSNEMMARGSVEINSINGEKLNTEELIWNDKTKRITSTKSFKFTRKDEILYGKGFTSDPDLTNYKIATPTGTVKLKDDVMPK